MIRICNGNENQGKGTGHQGEYLCFDAAFKTHSLGHGVVYGAVDDKEHAGKAVEDKIGRLAMGLSECAGGTNGREEIAFGER